MPLVTMCGQASSGKSRLAEALVAAVEAGGGGGGSAVVVREWEEGGWGRSREETCGSGGAGLEKEQRGLLRSAVERSLGSGAVVVLDSMAYVKSFRYELFTLAKQHSTAHLCLYVRSSPETCARLNAARGEAERLSEATLEALRMRFEEPSASVRWDSPLVVLDGDAAATAADGGAALRAAAVAEALAALSAGPRHRAGLSTQRAAQAPQDFLASLDSLTKAMVKEILSAQDGALPGDRVELSVGTEAFVQPSERLTMGQLSRLRRHFQAFAKDRPSDPNAIPNLFLAFLHAQLRLT